MYNDREVRTVCAEHNISVRKQTVGNEWRIVPQELVGTKDEEPVAYYTDDNEDAVLTAIRMRRNRSFMEAVNG